MPPSISHPLALPTTAAPGAPDDAARRQALQWTAAAGAVAAVATAVPLVSSFAPSERARAQGAAVVVDVSTLAPGELRTVEWRGKPVWIQRRSEALLAALAQTPTADLADPASARDQQPAYARNAQRSVRPDIFVAVGICTHLGCSPTPVAPGAGNPGVGEGWTGGFFCPCHGSTFDLAGRVYRNKPAPTNLEIPPHHFTAGGALVIGEDPPAA